MVEEGKTEGGIEQSRIIGDIEPYLLCNKCTKLAWKPKMCAGCNTLFCTSCYDPWAATQSTPQLCPKCDVQGKIKSAHAVYFRDMRKLQYKCHNYERCKETIKYDIFYTHKCPYDQIPCSGPNCKEEIFRKDVEQHEEKCSYIVEECGLKGCKERVERGGMKCHMEGCDYNLVVCRGCGIELLKRGQVEHEGSCPDVRVKCGNEGCGEEPPRKEEAFHALLCDYRMHSCQDCGENMPFGEYRRHFSLCKGFGVCPKCNLRVKKEGEGAHAHDCLRALGGYLTQSNELISLHRIHIEEQSLKMEHQRRELGEQERKIKCLEGENKELKEHLFGREEEFASGSRDGFIKLMNKHLKEIYSLKSGSEWVCRVVHLRDGRLASAQHKPNEIKLWDLQKHEAVSTLSGHTDAIWSVCEIMNKQLVSASHDNSLKIWSLKNGKQLRSIKGGMEDKYGLVSVFQHSNTQLVSGSDNGLISMWDYETGKSVRVFPKTLGCIWKLCELEDGSIIHIADNKLSLRVLDPRSGECTFENKTGPSYSSLCLMGDTLSCGGNGVVDIWDIRQRQVLNTHKPHAKWINAIIPITPQLICTASEDHTVALYHLGHSKSMGTAYHWDKVFDVVQIAH